LKVIKKPSSLQEITEFLRLTGKRIGFVPTMGALHEGHVSLLLNSSDLCDITIASVFVNPIQFTEETDLEKYPRDFKRDYFICQKANVDYIFYPSVDDMYGENYLTEVKVKELSDKYEGEFRPGHFTGVASVVLKLLNIVKPHVAFFGQKDAQQCTVIKKMVTDLNLDTEIIVCDTVRESDGLAKSSRNVFLDETERSNAAVLYKALELGGDLILGGKYNNSQDVSSQMYHFIKSQVPSAEIQYIAITDNKLLDEIKDLNNFEGKVLVSLAVKFNGVRLIDNILLTKKGILNHVT
jgi:pantoate--beta-alanine ligase